MEKKVGIPRKRRTPEDIENAVFKATELLVSEKGFANVAFTEIMKRAGVEPNVMYNRFKSIDDLYDKFIRKYDYWLHDLIEPNTDFQQPVQSLKNIMVGLINALYDNVIMQEILIWEFSDRNILTNRTSMNREIHTKPFLEFFKKNLKNPIDFACFTAILNGGIFYLILHKRMSTFCKIDFNNEKEKELLCKTIEGMIDKVYDSDNSSQVH